MQLSLEQIAKTLVAPGKGILAADESSGTIAKRFQAISVTSSEDTRQQYREMLFTTAGLGEYISGVILYDETLRQSAKDGRKFTKVLRDAGVIPGIKVDKGAVALASAPGEKITEGLDGLRERLQEYKKLGADFAKWRAVINVSEGNPKLPSDYCLRTNAQALARYAALCQENHLVPIVEPEVIMDGSHSLETCYQVTERTLRIVFEELALERVNLEQMLLKPNMVISGTTCPKQGSVQEVAEATVKCFLRTVPAAVPGIVFLSGGQSDEVATAHLSAMNQLKQTKGLVFPWELSFSYGRALQAASLQAWGGKANQMQKGQKAFAHRARLNSAARYGKYTPAMEKEV